MISTQQPIRGPEWSGAQVVRTSLRVEPLSKSQEYQLKNQQLRLRTEQTKQQIQKMFHSFVHSRLRSEDDLERPGNEHSSYTSPNTADFRKIQKELKSKGFTSATNRVILLPVVDCHGQAVDSHRRKEEKLRSWNAKSA